MTATEIKERPILFSGPMVRAILEGRKTQTRRVVKQKVALEWLQPGMFTPRYVADPGNYLSPFGYAGDRLWVRETLEATADDIWYRADGAELDVLNALNRPSVIEYHEGVISSIHMPRWASRITLEITDVRVQRLQDISGQDAIAEGCSDAASLVKGEINKHYKSHFARVWDSINGKKYPWASNPWVWAITFKRIEK